MGSSGKELTGGIWVVKKWAATVRIDLEFRGLWGILRRSNMIQGLTEMVALRS